MNSQGTECREHLQDWEEPTSGVTLTKPARPKALLPAAARTQRLATQNIKPLTVCTPAVTGIRVNGQATNTIIAGTSGFVEVYGTCLGSARSVQIDGTGFTVSSNLTYDPVNFPDGQVNAFFATSGTATGGNHNVQVTTLNGTSPIAAIGQVFVTAITLKSFSLDLTVAGGIRYVRDCFVPLGQATMPFLLEDQ